MMRAGLSLAEKVGNAEEIAGCLINLGSFEGEHGNLATAIAHTERAIDEFERINNASGRAWGYSNLAFALARAGEYGKASERAEQSLAFSRAIGHSVTVAETLDTMSYIALMTGSLEHAGSLAEEAAAVFLELGMPPKARDAMARAADAWEQSGNAERARTALARAR
jgi:tetratricopeptide (TPR) repeat protein